MADQLDADPKKTGTPPPDGADPKKAAATPPEDDEASDDPVDMSDWAPEKVRKYVKDLRKENAKARTDKKELKTQLNNLTTQFEDLQGKVKGLSGEPAEGGTAPDAEALSAAVGSLQWENAVKDIAIENEIPKGELKYFRFALQEAASQLAEGEELDDADIAAVVSEVKARAQGGASASSVSGGPAARDGQPSPKTGEGSGAVTTEAFVLMGTTAKSQLYTQNPKLYNQLFQDAKAKKLLR